MNTIISSPWSAVYTGSIENFDDMAASPSRILVPCGDFTIIPSLSALGQDSNIFGDGFQKLAQHDTIVYPGLHKKDEYSYLQVSNFENLINNDQMLVINSSPDNLVDDTSQVSARGPTTYNSPTPSLITDDDQDHNKDKCLLYQDFQTSLLNETLKEQSPRYFQHNLSENSFQQLSHEDVRTDQTTQSKPTIESSQQSSNFFKDNLPRENVDHHSPIIESDNSIVNEIDIVQITPPPSHQTTPTQKKRHVNEISQVNNITVVTTDRLTSPIEDSTTPEAHAKRVSIVGSKRRAVDELEETPEEKRRKFLERNRIAASKCRQKKKAWVQDLKTKADSIIAKNNTLHSFVNELREEILTLKNQLLAHRNCDCNILQEYIKNGGHFSFERSAV